MTSGRSDIEAKLAAVGDEIKALTSQLQVSLEQLSFLQEVADEAETAKIVSETPLADRQYSEAAGDVERHRRYHRGLQESLAELGRRRDALLERLYQERQR